LKKKHRRREEEQQQIEPFSRVRLFRIVKIKNIKLFANVVVSERLTDGWRGKRMEVQELEGQSRREGDGGVGIGGKE